LSLPPNFFSKRTKEKRAEINANNELIFQSEEKVKRAAELIAAKEKQSFT
jgi:hypothetical protein